MKKRYVIGVDFGTDSVRSIVIDAQNGREISSRVSNYKRWGQGVFCDTSKNQFRQHPLDYMEGLEESVTGALKDIGNEVREEVIGIGVDTTGSTPAPVDREGNVLALKDEFRDNPNAMFVLWKDHTSVEEAEEINRVARSWGGTDFTKFEGGVYSSEWFWAKILHILREDPAVREAAFSWVEHADWIPAVLTGHLDPLRLKRSRCAAGHKAMWHQEWGGLPPEEFLVAVDPLLKGLRERLYTKTFTADESAGGLSAEWAKRLGLRDGTTVAVGAFDAHMGAVGTQVREKSFVMILGTSACDMAVSSRDVVGDKLVGGICGQVDGSILPGMVGLEAGQSSFGDVYAWFRDVVMWPLKNMLSETPLGRDETVKKSIEQVEDTVVTRLSEEASKLDTDELWPVSLDWLNGRRTPYADQRMKGAVIGLSLGTDAVRVFKSLVESTAFGARAIIERFQEEGIEIEEIVAAGGIPKKSPYVMQVLSDVMGMPVKITRTDQSGALGAAMFAAVAAGLYESVGQAQEKMGSGFITTYHPDKKRTAFYDSMYGRYREIGAMLEEQFRQ